MFAYEAESDRVLSIPGEVCRNFFVLFRCGSFLFVIIFMVSLADLMAVHFETGGIHMQLYFLAVFLLVFFCRICQGYNRAENLFRGVKGTLATDIFL